MEAEQISLPVIDQITNRPAGMKHRRRSVDRTIGKMRMLHEELNSMLYSRSTERPHITNPGDAYHLLQPFLEHLDHEEMWVVVLDTRNRVMGLVALYKGSVNSSQIRIAEIFRQAIVDNAPAIILAHNHPSGDATPSPDDIATTRLIEDGGKLLDIQVLDHLIVGLGGFVSLKERHLGFS